MSAISPVIAKYYTWLKTEYIKLINIDKLAKKADLDKNVWLKKSVNNFGVAYSSIWRHENLGTMKHYLFPKKTEYICTSFKIFRTGESSVSQMKNVYHNCIYAIMYSYMDNNKLSFEFVSACPTFKSADGEYRHRFITVNQLCEGVKKNPKIWDILDQYMIDQVKEKNIKLEYYHIIPPGQESIAKQLVEEIEKNNFPLIFYAASWMINYTRYNDGTLENHISDGYIESMFSTSDKNIFVKISDILKDINMGIYVTTLSKFNKDSDQVTHTLEIGQKFIPLTINDVENVNDIKLPAWREIYISTEVSNLVINGIAGGFPIFDNWFFIQGNKPEFWDNRISHLKLEHSHLASEIVKKLEQARRGTYIIDQKIRKEMYISYKMEGLSEAIEIPMDYAEHDLILADIILCTLIEHMGRSLADLPRIMELERFNTMYNGPMFRDFTFQSKYIFDFAYNLASLNVHLGIIHGDFHLNNGTLYETTY